MNPKSDLIKKMTDELQITVNGTVSSSRRYVNPAYNTWKNSYRGNVFRAIIYANNCILQDGMESNAIPVSLWNVLHGLDDDLLS